MIALLLVGVAMLAVAAAWTHWAKRHPDRRLDTDWLGAGTFAMCGLALAFASVVLPTL